MRNINDEDDDSNTAQTSVHWTARLKRGANGQILSTAFNMDLCVQNDPYFENLYWFNEMTRTPEVRSGTGWRPIKDKDITDAHTYVQDIYLRTVGYNIVKEIVLRDCERHIRHPVKDWLNSLIWDQNSRIKDWCPRYLGCEDNRYTRMVGRLFFIAAVARIFEPGCKCDYVLVLEGEQGLEKSKVWKELFREHHTDSLHDIASKDASIHMARFWCVEISEMAAYNKHDAALMKSFITRTTEQYRPPYGVFGIDVPRQCIIVGTINEESYLKDVTGGRRWWGIRCNKIDMDALQADRDQLFAEAVFRYKHDEPWWPEREFERQYIQPEQDARQVVDEMFNIVGEHVNSASNYVTEIKLKTLWGILFPQADQTMPVTQQRRMTDALRQLGFESKRGAKGVIWVRKVTK